MKMKLIIQVVKVWNLNSSEKAETKNDLDDGEKVEEVRGYS